MMKRLTWVIVMVAGTVFGVAASASAEPPAPPAKDFAADKGPDRLDPAGYPAEVATSYKLFAAKCSKCHTLARPINTNMPVEGWKMYVKRMMNKPDSGISPDQGKAIYGFLKWRQEEIDAGRMK